MNKILLKRIGAIVIDNVAILALVLGILINRGISMERALLISGVIFLNYSILTPIISKGYNFGKYMLGIKIVRDNYENPSNFQIIVRELSKIIYTIPLVGLVLIIISNYMFNKREDKKTLHDLIAKTMVIGV